MLAFDANLFPIVGQQVTLQRSSPAATNARIDLLLARANAKECEVVADRESHAGRARVTAQAALAAGGNPSARSRRPW